MPWQHIFLDITEMKHTNMHDEDYGYGMVVILCQLPPK